MSDKPSPALPSRGGVRPKVPAPRPPSLAYARVRGGGVNLGEQRGPQRPGDVGVLEARFQEPGRRPKMRFLFSVAPFGRSPILPPWMYQSPARRQPGHCGLFPFPHLLSLFIHLHRQEVIS